VGFCSLPLAGALCSTVVGGIGSSITESIGNWIATSCGDLAASAADLAAQAVNATTEIDLTSSWFVSNYELLLPIGLTLTVMTFILQLVRAAWRREGQALAQAAVGTAIGVLFSFGAIALTSTAVTVVDALSNGLFSMAHTNIADSIRRLVKVSEINSTSGLGWAVASVVALGCAAGCFMYWGVMVFRKVSVLVLVTLAVFVGAGGGWEGAVRWRRGWIEATATLILSKLLMTIVFVLGVTAIGQPSSGGGIAALSDVLSGIVVMALVLLCPMATYRFVHWAGAAEHADLHSNAAVGVKTAQAAAKQAATRAASMAAGGAGGGAIGGASPQGPDQVPGMDPGGEPSLPTSFKFPGSEDSSSESGDGGTPLITRPGQVPAMNPTTEGDAPTGDQGKPLISRAASGTTAASGQGSPSDGDTSGQPSSGATSASTAPTASGPAASGPDGALAGTPSGSSPAGAPASGALSAAGPAGSDTGGSPAAGMPQTAAAAARNAVGGTPAPVKFAYTPQGGSSNPPAAPSPAATTAPPQGASTPAAWSQPGTGGQ